MIAAIHLRYSIPAAALCCLLAAATSASAECAWVLWAQIPNPTPAASLLTSIALGAWPQRNECEQERIRKEEAKAAAILVCLPDTVDPRGPKGK